MAATLIKIDKNGSKHFEGMVACDRCGGAGGSNAWLDTGWTCYKCGGTGKVFAKWIERTPEYEAKLAEQRKARFDKRRKEDEQRRQAFEAQRLAKEEADRIAKEDEEARIKAEKAISQFVGQVGDKIDITAAYRFSAHFTTHIGWMEETMYIHNFKDESGNTLIWKTTKGIGSLNLQEGDLVHIKGTIKEHSVYKDEKQTALIRCKIEK